MNHTHQGDNKNTRLNTNNNKNKYKSIKCQTSQTPFRDRSKSQSMTYYQLRQEADRRTESPNIYHTIPTALSNSTVIIYMHGIFFLYRFNVHVVVLFDQPKNAERERTRRNKKSLDETSRLARSKNLVWSTDLLSKQSLPQNSIIQTDQNSNGRTRQDTRPLSRNSDIHLLNREVAECTPEREVICVDKVRNQRFGDVVHQRIKTGHLLLGSRCTTRVVRVRGRLRMKTQVEKVRESQWQDQRSHRPEQERRPKGPSNQDEEIRNLDRNLRSRNSLNRGDGSQIAQRD